MPEFHQEGGALDFQPPSGFPGQHTEVKMPRRGVFAISETLPLIQAQAKKMDDARNEWQRLRLEANAAKARAKKVRADLIVTLRVWGNAGSGNVPIKTSAERNEWADADPEVQQAELEADLAQTAQMVAREAYDSTAAVFDTMRSVLGMERDDLKRERSDPHDGP